MRALSMVFNFDGLATIYAQTRAFLTTELWGTRHLGAFWSEVSPGQQFGIELVKGLWAKLSQSSNRPVWLLFCGRAPRQSHLSGVGNISMQTRHSLAWRLNLAAEARDPEWGPCRVDRVGCFPRNRGLLRHYRGPFVALFRISLAMFLGYSGSKVDFFSPAKSLEEGHHILVG